MEPAVVHPHRPGSGSSSNRLRAGPSPAQPRLDGKVMYMAEVALEPQPVSRGPVRSPGGARGRSAGGGCGATASRSAALALFLLIVVLSASPRRSTRSTSPTTDPFDNNLNGHDDRQRQGGADHAAGRRRPAPRRDPDRADLGRAPLLPRRRQPGPRRRPRGCSTAAAARCWSGSARRSSAASSRRCSR